MQGHWLDRLEYGTKLDNPYNNYVNPFYLFDILSDEGRKFFIDYYEDEIEDIITSHSNIVEKLTEQLKNAKKLKNDISTEVKRLRFENVP